MTSPLPLLTDGNMTLRAVEPADIDIMLAWENDTADWPASDNTAPCSRHLLEQYVMSYNADIFAARQLKLIIDIDGEAAGAVDLFDFDPVNRRAALGIVIDRAFRGRGLSVRALCLIVRYSSACLGLHQLWAITAADNHPSRRMLDAAGFTASGRLRSWLRRGSSYSDAYLYQLLLPS